MPRQTFPVLEESIHCIGRDTRRHVWISTRVQSLNTFVHPKSFLTNNNFPQLRNKKKISTSPCFENMEDETQRDNTTFRCLVFRHNFAPLKLQLEISKKALAYDITYDWIERRKRKEGKALEHLYDLVASRPFEIESKVTGGGGGGPFHPSAPLFSNSPLSELSSG